MIACALLLAAVQACPGQEPVDYLRDVKPILSARCYACHGALRQKADLRLDTADLIRRGGKHGPALVQHDSAASVLIQAVTGQSGVRSSKRFSGRRTRPRRAKTA